MAAKVVSVMNLKGGVGKSTVAMILAEYLAFKFLKRVLVVDLDSQANLTHAMIKPLYAHDYLPKEGRTTYDLFAAFLRDDKKPIGEFICPYPDGVSNILRGQPRIVLNMVACTPDLARLDEHLVDLWERGDKIPRGIRLVLKEALAPVLPDYDTVIIDCPPGLSLFTSAAIIASDYFVSPLIPEPLSLLGIDLIQDRVADLKRRIPEAGIHIEFAGTILNKVFHWRREHREEVARMHGIPAGGRPAFEPGRFLPFKYWIPDAEHLRKLGSFAVEAFETSANAPALSWVHGKYGGTNVRPRNASGGHPLDLSSEEGVEYYLSARLERLTGEFMERTSTV